MGIFMEPVYANSDGLQHLLGAHHRLRGLALTVQPDHLCNLVAHGHHRIQCRHGVLKHHGHIPPPHPAELGFGHFENILSIQQDLTGNNAPSWSRHQIHDAQGCGRLSRSGLSHQSKGLTLCQRKGQSVYCLYHTLSLGKLHRQVLYG